MSSSMLKRLHTARAGGTTRARPFAWPFGLALSTVALIMMIATVGHGLSRTIQPGTPVASPNASPVASPAIMPVAGATGPSTQIIVGEITIEITDDGFVPTHFESAVGRDITINVVNHGNQPHNFTIEAFEIDIDLDPGDSATVEIENPPIATYPYYSDLPGDEDFEGTMTVFI